MQFPKTIIVRDKSHILRISSLPCLVTGEVSDRVIAHHIRKGNHAKGVSLKPGDDYTIPLHSRVHELLHRKPEIEFLASYGIEDPVNVANTLYLMVLPQDCYEYIVNRFSGNWKNNIRKLQNKC